jgi:UDP-N-acetylmuramate--alanine ligase
MNNNITHVYLIGIGGIGMSAVARYFKAMGKCVAGYDKTETLLTNALQTEGMDIHFNDAVNAIPESFTSRENKENILVIYTPAIPASHHELHFFRTHQFVLVKRSEVLGWITANQSTIAVAGTHGKTTTSSMVAHLLKSADMNVAAFLGGITKNYNSNFILPSGEKEVIYVVEADEFDRSFLTLFPTYAIITSMDADHLDIYGDKEALQHAYNLFAKQVMATGVVFAKKGLPIETTPANQQTYSISQQADHTAEHISIQNNAYCFDFLSNTITITNIVCGLAGRHNVENAVAAIAVALQVGVKPEAIKQAMASYQGVNRRFDVQLKTDKITFIDDYAHHPEELRAAISSVKELYRGKKITGIFQPHLFSRTFDFADDFAACLNELDEVILLPIYPAREAPMEGVTSKLIFDKIKNPNKLMIEKEKILTYINNNHFEVLITLGAGDIDTLVLPIKNCLAEKYKMYYQN